MLPIIKESDFRKELKSAPRAGYLFFGEEDYLKAFAVKQARELISPDPSLAFFNDMRLDAVEFTPQKLLDALTPLPMMADRKLITVSGLNFNAMRPNELEELCEVLGELEAYDYNLLILIVYREVLIGLGLDTESLRRRLDAVAAFAQVDDVEILLDDLCF